ncbi:MAG: hypothetical protein ABIN67_13505, partial [Ferruginibacter sp.]
GVQASFLVSKKKRQDPVSYDYQMNPLSLPANPPPTTAAAPQQQDFSLSVRSVDYRLLGGIRYTKGKTSVALTYQHGLQPVLQGNRLSSEGNRVVALKVLYKIK